MSKMKKAYRRPGFSRRQSSIRRWVAALVNSPVISSVWASRRIRSSCFFSASMFCRYTSMRRLPSPSSGTSRAVIRIQ